jgi:ADP-ribose pyrophosphatase
MPKKASTKRKGDAKTLPKGVKLVSSKLIYDGPAFRVFSDRVQEGKYTGQRDVVRHTGSVVILALDESGAGRGEERGARKRRAGERNSPGDVRVLLERQFRWAAKQYLWELPAGRIDEGEETLAGAKRELLEETGITAKKWKRLFRFYASPGFLDETMDLFLATELTLGEAQPEEDEQIETRFFPASEAIGMALNGKIKDSKTLTALLWLGMRGY